MTNKTSQKTLLKLWQQNKKIILFICIISMLIASIYAYMKVDIYETHSSIDLGHHDIHASQNMVDSLIYNRNFISSGTEIELIQSKLFLKNILSKVDLKYHYFLQNIIQKKELYTDSPFEVDMIYGENLLFFVTYINKQYYQLKVEGVDQNTLKPWSLEKMYLYSKPVQSKYFMFTLTLKNNMKLQENKTYMFKVSSDDSIINKIQNNLNVISSEHEDSIIKVYYRDTIPQRAREVNNALVQEYLIYNIKRKTLESSRILAFIDEQISGINGEMKTSEDKIDSLKKKGDVLALSYNTQELLQKVERYEEELSSISEKLSILNNLYNAIKKGNSTLSFGNSFSSPGLERSIEKYYNAINKRKTLRVDYTMAHPSVVSVTKNIKNIKKTIFSTIKTLRFGIEKRKKKLLGFIKKYNRVIKKMPEKEKIYGDLKRKFVVNEKIYGYFLKKRAMTAIAKASAVNQIRVIENAIFPSIPILPNRILIILIGGLIGLLLSILIIMIRGYIDDTIKNEEDIRDYSSLPLLGSIPYIKENQHSLKVFDSPKSLVTESFRALRTNLQFISKEKKNIVISVTSTVGDEGKTTVSSNLAGIISLRGKKVIILNMDMRKPALHHKFSLPNVVGISTLLSSNNELHEVIQHTKYEDIDIISSGPTPPNPSELIENNILEKVLNELKNTYDIIILDTPPIGLVTDAMHLIKISDVTLYVVRAKHSKKAFLDNIKRLKEEHKIKGLNLLLNGVKNSDDGYGYYEE